MSAQYCAFTPEVKLAATGAAEVDGVTEALHESAQGMTVVVAAALSSCPQALETRTQ